MLIKDIRNKELRELAQLRAKQHAAKLKPIDSSYVWGAFIWEQTPERAEFWTKVINREITELNPIEINHSLHEEIMNDLAKENKLLKERVRGLKESIEGEKVKAYKKGYLEASIEALKQINAPYVR